MRRLGLEGVRRVAPCPLDRVRRQFRADRHNQLWVSDFTYASTWRGRPNVAFVIEVFARRVAGWRVSHSMRTDFVLESPEHALYARQPDRSDAMVPHSDWGSQYASTCYTERLAETGIGPPVGCRGDSHDNALAETMTPISTPASRNWPTPTC
jgi:transposase InsO family protein